jgi:hypothetical protein
MILSAYECDRIAEAMAQEREFRDSLFQRSRKGNLWCRWNGVTLTVYEYPKGSGCYRYCIAGDGGPSFSEESWESEEEAIAHLWEQLPRAT